MTRIDNQSIDPQRFATTIRGLVRPVIVEVCVALFSLSIVAAWPLAIDAKEQSTAPLPPSTNTASTLSVSGTVRNDAGKGVRGTLVTLTGLDSEGVRQTITDAKGHYRFDNLSSAATLLRAMRQCRRSGECQPVQSTISVRMATGQLATTAVSFNPTALQSNSNIDVPIGVVNPELVDHTSDKASTPPTPTQPATPPATQPSASVAAQPKGPPATTSQSPVPNTPNTQATTPQPATPSSAPPAKEAGHTAPPVTTLQTQASTSPSQTPTAPSSMPTRKTTKAPASSRGNHAPILAPIPPMNAFIGEPVSLTLQATDPDATDATQLTYALVSASLPSVRDEGALDVKSGAFRWTPHPSPFYVRPVEITFEVSDAHGATNRQTATIMVMARTSEPPSTPTQTVPVATPAPPSTRTAPPSVSPKAPPPYRS